LRKADDFRRLPVHHAFLSGEIQAARIHTAQARRIWRNLTTREGATTTTDDLMSSATYIAACGFIAPINELFTVL
jgi:hypothetical protein